MPEPGEQFLHSKDPKLHLTSPVEHESSRKKMADEQVSQKPADKIADWLKVIEHTHIAHRDDPRVLERIRNFYHQQYVIKPTNIPESYFDNQRRLAREQGHGDIEITPEIRRQSEEVIITDQKTTLDIWLNYFTSPDSYSIPMWTKYWAFTGMLKLSSYDKQTHSFAARDKSTVAPFPDLNREALAYVIDHMVKKYGKEYLDREGEIAKVQRQLDEIERYEQKVKIVETGIDVKGKQVKPEFLEQIRESLGERPEEGQQKTLQEKLLALKSQQEKLLRTEELVSSDKETLATEEFGKLYAFAIEKVTPTEENELLNTNGVWIKYARDSDHMPLVQSLQGFGTGWCTAGESTAQAQLQGGDFYVFYTYGKKDTAGKPSIPRVAIRMQENSIAEARGIAEQQNLDPYIGEVVEEKLKEFPDGKTYQKKVADMKLLTEIEKKTQGKQDLGAEDLRFLYEIDSNIEGFGYEKDPRIEEIRSKRMVQEDMLIVFNCDSSQIARNAREIGPNTKAYVGSLEPGIFDQIVKYNIDQVYTAFPEGRIRRQIDTIGGKKKEQLEHELNGAKVWFPYAKTMMDNPKFTTRPIPEDIETVKLTVKDLGFKQGNPTTDQIYKRAAELGLDLCPAELGPHRRLKDISQPEGDYYYIAMDPITDSYGHPYVFELFRDGGELRLRDDWALPDYRWSLDYEFVFSLRKSSSQNFSLLDKIFKR